MIRSSEQTRRRRSLASAAAGRTAVVLLACSDDPDAASTLADLQRFADARDWHVVETYTAPAPPSTPLDERPEWSAVRELITEGRAEGVVAPAVHVPADRGPLDTWLADYGAFLAAAPLPSTAVPHPSCRAAHFLTHCEADPS